MNKKLEKLRDYASIGNWKILVEGIDYSNDDFPAVMIIMKNFGNKICVEQLKLNSLSEKVIEKEITFLYKK